MARDKWKRFFQAGFQKVEIDSARSVKNLPILGYKEFVYDEFDKFTDEERLRVLDATQDRIQMSFLKIKENVLEQIGIKVLRNQVDFRNGHLLLMLANSLTNFLDSIILRGKHESKYIFDLNAKGLLNFTT